MLLLCLFGIFLPTADVFSDVTLVIQLITATTLEKPFECLSDGSIVQVRRVRDGKEDCSDGSDEGGKETILITNWI